MFWYSKDIYCVCMFWYSKENNVGVSKRFNYLKHVQHFDAHNSNQKCTKSIKNFLHK